MEKFLSLIPWFLMGAIVLIPFLCLILYKMRKVRTCLVFSHLWCMIAFLVLGAFLLITVRRSFSGRLEYADKAGELLQAAVNLREGKTDESINRLDSIIANNLHRSAYDISVDKMGDHPDILWTWQQFKEYVDTYDIEGHDWGMVNRKLTQIPWSNMQLGIKKFEQTYGNGKIAAAPGVNIKSWITLEIPDTELNNKVILLDFWNIRCGPCVKSLPDLQILHDNYKDRGLVVIACAGGNAKKTKKFLDEHGYSFPTGMAANRMYSDYAVKANPSYFMIDRNGNLVWGPEHRLPTDDELEKQLQ